MIYRSHRMSKLVKSDARPLPTAARASDAQLVRAAREADNFGARTARRCLGGDGAQASSATCCTRGHHKIHPEAAADHSERQWGDAESTSNPVGMEANTFESEDKLGKSKNQEVALHTAERKRRPKYLYPMLSKLSNLCTLQLSVCIHCVVCASVS
jgi:hypothetical protein